MISRNVAVAALALQLLGAAAPAVALPTPPVQAAVSATALPASGAYKIDPAHAQVRMSWNHLGLSNPGAVFETVEGVIRIDEANPERSSVSVRLPVSGVDTGVPQLDADFLTDKFFDADRHPDITFQSRSVERVGLGRAFKVQGDLTVRGVTRPVTLDAVLNGAGRHPMTGAPAVGFAATTVLKRSDFGLTVALPMVSDEIKVEITLEAVADQAEAS